MRRVEVRARRNLPWDSNTGSLALPVKTLALEEIYADPHKLDIYLASGESVAVVHGGREVAELVPRRTAIEPAFVVKRPQADYRARFLKMWGPDAFNSEVSVADEFAELRCERPL
jgi:hypothetical protein